MTEEGKTLKEIAILGVLYALCIGLAFLLGGMLQ